MVHDLVAGRGDPYVYTEDHQHCREEELQEMTDEERKKKEAERKKREEEEKRRRDDDDRQRDNVMWSTIISTM